MLGVAYGRWLAIALLATGCRVPCDADGLQAAAEAMQDRTPEGRASALRELADACPKIPPALGQSLQAGYGSAPADVRAMVYADRFDDPGYAKARKQTCDLPQDRWLAAVKDGERDRDVFAACKLARYGLLDQGERFAFEDLDAYVLYEWLVSNRNDREVSRRLVRGLLTTGASREELLRRCLTESRGCVRAFRRRGVDLPAAAPALFPLRAGQTITISTDQVSVEDEDVLALDRGTAEKSAFVHHVSAPLREVLEARARQGREAAASAQEEWQARVILLADAYIPVGTIIDVMFTARKAGFREYALGVLANGDLEAVPVTPTIWWYEGAGRDRRPRSKTVELFVDTQSVRAVLERGTVFVSTGDCWDDPQECFDHEALGAWMKAAKQTRPRDTVVALHVDPDVPYQAVVALIDTARGRDCRLGSNPAASGEIPPECLFWQPVVDGDPPLYWAIDTAPDFSLGDAKASRPDGGRVGPPGAKNARRLYEERKAKIRACMVDDRTFMRALDAITSVSIMWGTDRDGNSPSVRVFTGADDDVFGSADLEHCVARVLGFDMANRNDASDFIKSVRCQLTIPIERAMR